MSFRFILGRAGSGKTRYCLDAVAAELRRSPDGPPLILLVPEQATFQMDRALATLPGIGAVVRAQVLSFHRLAWRVLGETGGAARPHIDEVGKAMALRALLARRRGELRVFHSTAGRPGFIDRLARTISELHAYGVTPEDLRAGYESLAALGRGDTALAGKLHDLAVISGDLAEYLTGRWVDPGDYLSLLAARLELRPPCVAGARVWVDGFAGFTPQELAVLEALLGAAAEVSVALCLGPEDLDGPRDGSSTFHPVLRTYDVLTALATKAGAGPADPVVLTGAPRFAAAPALAHLAREYPRPRPRPFGGRPDADPGAGLTLVEAETRRAEVLAAAREMVRLAREEGFRWREMSVLVRSLDGYAELLQSTLAEFSIPFFLDHRRPMAYHPLIQFVRSAVEAAATDWAAWPVFRLLKTDLAPLSREEVDLLENYVLAHGVRGRAWTRDEPWAWRRFFSLDETLPPDPAAEERLARVDSLRRRVAALLGPFVAAVTSGGGRRREVPVRERVAALRRLLDTAGVPATLAAWRAEAAAAGRPDVSQEHERALDGLLGLLDQMAANLGEGTLPLSEFGRILEAGLENLRPGRVPPGLDQVLVGSVDRSRQPDIRACFVLGANDGVFPGLQVEDVIFDDREREELRASYGMDLSPSAADRAFSEDYFVYIALTRPSERLWVSYARSDDQGRALAPSPLVARLRQMFPVLSRTGAVREAGLTPSPGEVASDAEALAGVARFLAESRRRRPAPAGSAAGPVAREDAAGWLEIYNWLVADPERRRRADAALRAVGHRNRAVRLDGGLVATLLGRAGPDLVVSASVSRLEEYGRCPFSHFARAALRLEPRPRQQLRAPEIGTYYHAVLSVFTRGLIADEADLAGLGPAEVASRLRRAVEEVRPRLESDILASTAYYRYLGERLERTVGRTVEVLAEHARRSRFRPVGVEIRFVLPLELAPPGASEGAPGAPPPQAQLRTQLTGVVDRLEAAETDAGVLVRVIDFKSRRRHFRAGRTFVGLDLQLPVYLLAAVDPAARWPGRGTGSAAAVPTGALFFPVTDPFVRAAGPLDDEALRRERARSVRLGGLVLAEPEVLDLMDREAAGTAPPILPVSFTSRGRLRASSAGVTRVQLELLVSFARRKVGEMMGAMLTGSVDIAPVSESPRVAACRYCDYRAVCRFDPGAGDQPRRVVVPPENRAWELMGREAQPDRGD